MSALLAAAGMAASAAPARAQPAVPAAGNAASSSLPGGASSLNETYRDWRVACAQQGAAKRCVLSQIQAQQNEATQRLGRMQAMAPFLRMIPSGLLAGLGRFLLSRSAIKRFIEGASRISLTFKPERNV